MSATPIGESAGARYDGVADWFDHYVSDGGARHITSWAQELLTRLLGTGAGWCLDLGCGSGVHIDTIRSLGWQPIGVDVSADQLRVCRQRRSEQDLVNATADRLPLRDGSVAAVATVMTATDFDDLGEVICEAARVLAPGGRLVVVTAHPCFGGSFVTREQDGAVTVHPGYRQVRRIEEHPLLGDGIRSRVGTVNVPLAHLFQAILHAGLQISGVQEDRGPAEVPHLLGVSATG